MPGADAPKSDISMLYVDKLLRHPEVAMLPFPDPNRPDGVPFAEMYVDQTVVEEQRERQSAPAAEADTAGELHAAMIREVVRQVEVDLWQALTERSRVVVEAPASTGKSTLCRWVTHQCYACTAWFPILIPFRDFAQSEKSLRQYLDEDYTAWLGLQGQGLTVELSDGSRQARTVGHWLDDEWQSGKALVILDGADEEFVPERRKQALDFVTLSQAARPRVLLTSRPLGASAPGFAQVQLQEFTPQQIDRLVRRCGAIVGAPDKAEQFLTDMQRTENLRVRHLAGRPGHLVQMLAAYVQDGVLLTAEDDLMQYMAERRLAITGRVAPPLQPDKPHYKRQVAEALAFHLLFCRRGQAQKDEPMLSLVRQTLREVKVNGIAVYTARDGGTVLEDLCRNSGVLKQTRRGAYEVYEWESVLWLQFFAAAHIARKLRENDSHFTQWVYAKGKVKQSALQCAMCAMALPPFSHYFWHGEWQDTVTLLAGLLDDGTALLRRIQAEPDDIFHQMANMAARCLGRARAVAPKVAKQIIDTAGQAWLQTMMEDHSPDVTALQALARGRNRKWSEQVFALMGLGLKVENLLVRQAAAEALGQLPTPEAVAVLRTALQDTDEEIRRAAAEALGQHSALEAVAALRIALRDTSLIVRQAAAEALGQHPTPEAATILRIALQDTDKEVRRAAVEALRQLSILEAVAPLRIALQDTDEEVRWAAVEALGQYDTIGAVAALCTALQDTDKEVRWAAVEALGQHPTLQALAALHTMCQDTDKEVRWAAVEALGQHLTPEAVAPLRTALQDTDEMVRWTAAEALGQPPTLQALAALCIALQNKDWLVCQEAVTDALSPLLAVARRQQRRYIWEALWCLSQRTKIWIDADGQWHPLPPVEPAFQNVTELQ